MSLRFADLPLSREVLRALDEMGYTTPTKVQSESIPPVLRGRDLMAQAPTGTGKTTAFGLGIANRCAPGQGLQALVLTPTRELCEQVSKELLRLYKFSGLRVHAIYGGVSYGPQADALRQGYEVIVGTPGRVMDHMRQKAMRLERLRVLVLDEADRMLDMGFVGDIEWIMERAPKLAQHLLFSATLPYEVELLAEEFCNQPAKVVVAPPKDIGERREELVIEVGRKNKPWALHRILEHENPKLAFVFCRTRRTAEHISQLLRRHHYSCEAMHGDMGQGARERVMEKVRRGEVKVVVATDVLARGIDVRMCDLVVNYDPPEEADSYVHRVGRTARMDDVGKAITLATKEDARSIIEIEGHAGARLRRADVPASKGRDRIKKREDWSEFADPIGMVHFRIQGAALEGRTRMDVFWALVKELRLRDSDVGHLRADGDAYVFEVPEPLAGRVAEGLERGGLMGGPVEVEPVRSS